MGNLTDNEVRARDFMDWFAANGDRLRGYVTNYDADIFEDAMLRVYDAIALRGAVVRDPVGYFVRTYRNTLLHCLSARRRMFPLTSQDVADEPLTDTADGGDFDPGEAVANMLRYIGANYSARDALFFELYVRLAPGISLRQMGRIYGVPFTTIAPVIGRVKRDVAGHFDFTGNADKKGTIHL